MISCRNVPLRVKKRREDRSRRQIVWPSIRSRYFKWLSALKRKQSTHTEGQLIFISSLKDRLVRTVIANFGPDQQM